MPVFTVVYYLCLGYVKFVTKVLRNSEFVYKLDPLVQCRMKSFQNCFGLRFFFFFLNISCFLKTYFIKKKNYIKANNLNSKTFRKTLK